MKHDPETVEAVARAMWEANPGVWGDYMPDEWDDATQESRYGDIITWDEFVTHKLAMDWQTDNYQARDYRRMAEAALDVMNRPEKRGNGEVWIGGKHVGYYTEGEGL